LSPASLWQRPDFLRLWSAQTISLFGSLVTRAALPFLAILVLHATAGQIAGLNLANLLPAFLVGLLAGVWLDRVRRRPVMVAADLGRALALGAIPMLAITGHLGLLALYLVAVIASGLTVAFDIAQQSYLPSIVEPAQLVDANSKLAATQSISEVSAFGIAGWLVQWFTAPIAIAIDALSFVVSAILLGSIRSGEAVAASSDARPRAVWKEMTDGLMALGYNARLRALALSNAAMECAYGLLGTVYALYALRELGFHPGLLGMIYALGGVSSLAASIYAGRINRRLGGGRAIAAGLLLAALGSVLVPLASGAGVLALLCLVGQQLVGDGGATIADINLTSLRQALSPPALLGRINAGTRFAALGASIAGTALGGLLGQTAGYRFTLVCGALVMLAGAVVVASSPVMRLRDSSD
jgi:MFS family permease